MWIELEIHQELSAKQRELDSKMNRLGLKWSCSSTLSLTKTRDTELMWEIHVSDPPGIKRDWKCCEKACSQEISLPDSWARGCFYFVDLQGTS